MPIDNLVTVTFALGLWMREFVEQFDRLYEISPNTTHHVKEIIGCVFIVDPKRDVVDARVVFADWLQEIEYITEFCNESQSKSNISWFKNQNIKQL